MRALESGDTGFAVYCLKKAHNIEAVVDRLVIKKDIRSRLAESIETAVKMRQGSGSDADNVLEVQNGAAAVSS